MEFRGHTYQTATARYTLRDGRPCQQRIWSIDGGDWHTRYLAMPFTVDVPRDDERDTAAEAEIMRMDGVTREEAAQ